MPLLGSHLPESHDDNRYPLEFSPSNPSCKYILWCHTEQTVWFTHASASVITIAPIRTVSSLWNMKCVWKLPSVRFFAAPTIVVAVCVHWEIPFHHSRIVLYFSPYRPHIKAVSIACLSQLTTPLVVTRKHANSIPIHVSIAIWHPSRHSASSIILFLL